MKPEDSNIEVLKKAIDALTVQDPQVSDMYHQLGVELLAQSQHGGPDNFEAALDAFEKATKTASADNPEKGKYCIKIAHMLTMKYGGTGLTLSLSRDLDSVSKDISRMQSALEGISANDVNRQSSISMLATMFVVKNCFTRESADVEEAARYAREAVISSPQERPNFNQLVQNYYQTLEKKNITKLDLSRRQVRLLSVRDTISVIKVVPKWLADLSSEVEATVGKPGIELGDGIDIFNRWTATGQRECLDAAINLFETHTGDEFQTDRLTTLGHMLRSRYEVTGQEEDLQKAAENTEKALSLTGGDGPARGAVLRSLAQLKSIQYKKTGDLEYLNTSLSYLNEALLLTQGHDSLQEAVSADIGSMLHARWKGTGSKEDLGEAITTMEKAVELATGHPEKQGVLLSNLAAIYLSRYESSKNLDELNLAIQKSQGAVNLLPEGYVQYNLVCFNLSICSHLRYQRLGHSEDLETCVSSARKALALTAEGSPVRLEILGALGSALHESSLKTNDKSQLEEAVATLLEAVRLTPPNHPSRLSRLCDLAMGMNTQYNKSNDIEYLDSSIKYLIEAKDIEKKGHPRRAITLSRLGLQLFTRARMKKNADDVQAAIAAINEAVNCDTSSALDRVVIACTAIQATRDYSALLSWKNQLVDIGFRLLPYACSRELSRRDQQFASKMASGLASLGCSLALKAGNVEGALKRLEFGRGLILGNLIDRRDDLAELERENPYLAQAYKKLREDAFQRVEDQEGESLEMLLQKKRGALTNLLLREETIRKMPGFEEFLGAPSVKELQQCASGGPIIIVNVSNEGSDAIIVTEQKLETIPLPDLLIKVPGLGRRVNAQARSGSDILLSAKRDIESEEVSDGSDQSHLLTELWEHCVSPIFNRLGFLGNEKEKPRVWWIGSGAASSLPFHAAGDFTPRLAGDITPTPDQCMFRVISSYTQTIKALKFARERAREGGVRETVSLAIVTMPSTPGYGSLPGVRIEKDVVETEAKLFCQTTSLEHPTAQEVLEQLKTSQIVHFACHGSSDAADPSQSHLLLQKPSTSGKPEVDKLTVGSLLDATTNNNLSIAYLSACSTAESQALDLRDEGLHLVSAFQMAGFPHAVGSLWQADDETCAKMARYFYESLASASRGGDEDEGRVAKALLSATMRVRLDGGDLWVPFVHYGA